MMADDKGGSWERETIEKLAFAAIREQRRARRWGIFFKLLGFAYVTLILVLAFDWRERTEGSSEAHTALVELNGVIGPGTDASAEKIVAALNAAFRDKGTRGVVVRINSPGGSPVQAQTIYDEMRRLRQKHPNVPLYAVVEDVCASGGYFVAVGADRIYVSKSSIIGSIGVRMDNFGFTGLMEKLGVERRLLTAGQNKSLLDPFLPVDEKQREHVLGMLGDIHEQFIGVVKEGRGTRLRESPEVFSGLIWTGTRGIELGLADGIGTLDTVARDVIKAEAIVDYTQKENVAEKLARRFGASVASVFAESLLRGSATLR